MTLLVYLLIIIGILPLLIGTIAICIYTGNRRNTAHQGNNQIPALLFHSVIDTPSLEQSRITIKKLDEIFSYLNQQQYKTLTVHDAVHRTESGIPQQVALVFDDGFENFYTNAFPLLARYRITVSLFPVAGFLDTVSSWDTYAPQKQLTKEQIRLIADAGHEIGSHTLTHPDLVLLCENELKRELSESKKVLEDIAGRAITSLSFPFGSWNTRVWKCAQECGYEAAVAYRHHTKALYPAMLPATGMYAFDTVHDIIAKIERKDRFSNVHARNRIMPHFAKGTPVWKFRKTYDIFNFFR